MERPRISQILLEAAASYSIYEDTLRRIDVVKNELASGKYWAAKSIIMGQLEQLQDTAKERLQEYHNAMDTILSIHCLIPTV